MDRMGHLKAIEDARTECVPWSIIPAIERIGKGLISDREILATATAEFNYGIYWNKDPAAGLSRFYVITLPKIHRANAFLHVLVGHEFFHPLLEDFFDTETKAVSTTLRQGCLEILKSREEGDDLFAEQRLDEFVETTLMVWRRALEEIMCDLGCGAIFGPAAILSSSYFALSQNLDEQPSPEGQWYPPWRLRMRALVERVLDSEKATTELDRLRQILTDADLRADWERLDEQLQLVREITATDSDLDKINRNAFVALAYKSVHESLEAAWAYIDEITRQLPDVWIESLEQVPTLLRCLESLVPPGEFRQSGNEVGVAAELAAINLAGWLYLLRTGPPASLEDFHRTCRLMLKAYEDSELKRVFPGEANGE